MDTAQRMVDEAAKRAGYTVKAYHGTPNGTYTVFRDWSYFTENKDYADVYQNQGASSNRYKKTADNPKTYSVYLALLGNEDNDVVYDKEKDEASLRVAISEQRFGRAEDASSKGRLAQTSEEVKTSRETVHQSILSEDVLEALGETRNPEGEYTGKARFSRDIPGDTEALRAENEALKDRLAYWQSQVKLSDRTQPRDEDVRRVARDLLKTYESKADKDATAAALRELAHTVMSDEVRWTDVRDQATRLAGSILEGAERLGENTELHREIRAAIRSQKLSFSEQGNIPDYNQWRKANFGRLTISKDGVPVETRWQELQLLVRKTGPGDGGLSSVARSDIQGSCLFLSLRRVRRQDLSVGTGPDVLFYPTKPGSVPTGGSICFSNRNIPSDPSPVS